MTGPLLDIDRLSVAIGEAQILSGVSLKVAPGEIVGLVGESGSGKSMTALAAMQLLPEGARVEGAVRLDGQDLTALSEAALCDLRGRAIGMIFQEPMTALNPLQTIGRQVAETVRIHTGASKREADRVARETLDRVGLPAERFGLERYPHDLSGGQRQRVVIAMAIALKPKLLIADEPTTALDVTTQAQILDLLKSLVDEDGVGLVLISHDLAVVAGMADRIAIMQSGAVIEQGGTAALLETLAHPYSRRLFAASSHVPPRRRPTRGGDRPLLELRDIVREYPASSGRFFGRRAAFRAVDHVSFTVHRGENVGLVGESGCGKSTLARAILGLEPLQGGAIALDGRLFADGDQAVRRAVQIVFQDPYGSFNPRHRVDRLITEPFHLLKDRPSGAERERRVDRALTEVGLQPADKMKYSHEFSGGQRQRLAIARALIIEPSLIVLDEAVSALDVSIRAQILDLLAELSDRLSISYLFISHDLSVVRAITDRVLVMRAGRIVEEGPTEAVFAAPRHPYTQALVAATPVLDARWRRTAEDQAAEDQPMI